MISHKKRAKERINVEFSDLDRELHFSLEAGV